MSKSDTAINVRVLIEQWKVCSEYLRAYNSQAMNRAADRGDALYAALEAATAPREMPEAVWEWARAFDRDGADPGDDNALRDWIRKEYGI